MNKEEIKDYLKRVEELETKLTGKDKDTYQWLIFGYNECAKLLYEEEQKNKQLKDRIDKAIKYIEKCDPDNLNSMFLDENYISNYGACELLKILKGENND